MKTTTVVQPLAPVMPPQRVHAVVQRARAKPAAVLPVAVLPVLRKQMVRVRVRLQRVLPLPMPVPPAQQPLVVVTSEA